MQLKGRNFLKLMDYTPEEITYLIDLSQELKEKKKKGIRHDAVSYTHLDVYKRQGYGACEASDYISCVRHVWKCIIVHRYAL